MDIATALRMTPLSHGRCVGGARGLAREIRWVHVVDHPEIEPWVKPGDLLMTTGFSWPTGRNAGGRLIERLAAIGVAGIVLAVPRFLKEFPREAIEAADSCRLPLIEIPWEIPFVEIMTQLHRDVIDRQGSMIERADRIHRELTRASVEGAGLDDIAATLGKLIGRPVSIIPIEWGLLHGQRPAATLTSETIMKLADAHGVVEERQGAETGAQLRHLFAVRVRAELVAAVIVLGQDGLGDLERRAIESASTIAALHIAHQRELAVQEERLGYAFVDSLLEGRYDQHGLSAERARLQGWRATEPYVACALVLNEQLPLSREAFLRREHFARRARAELQRIGLAPLVSVTLDQVRMLVPADTAMDRLRIHLAADDVAMAVSGPHGGLAGMLRAAHELNEVARNARPGELVRYDDFSIERVLTGDDLNRDRFVRAIYERIGPPSKSARLIETLEVLCTTGFHLRNAAHALGIHISSLRSRVATLEARLGMSISDEEARFKLQIAARLKRIRSSAALPGQDQGPRGTADRHLRYPHLENAVQIKEFDEAKRERPGRSAPGR